MADISERLTVYCPFIEASHYISTFITGHSVGNGAVSIALRLPGSVLAGRLSPFERQVVATLYPLCSSNDPNPTYSVSVTPLTSSPLPHFAGAMAVAKCATDDRFSLIITGHYEAPFGLIGSVFDVAFGRRIAHAVARNLLHTIGEYVQYASARNKAARASSIARSGHGAMLQPAP